MCGEDKEKKIMNKTEKKNTPEEICDVAISKLLQDFSSAALFPQSGDSTLNEPVMSTSSSCEAVVTSLKDLHLRRPANSRRRISRRHSFRKKHPTSSLNLAVAAGNFQKPIVWPARLSGQCRRGSTQILNPSRLCIEVKHDNSGSVQSAKVKKATKLPQETQKKKDEFIKLEDIAVFGSASSVDFSDLSFSSVCKTSTSSCPSLSSSSVEALGCVSSPISKRHSTSDVPPAKFARTVSQDDESVPKRTVFSNYRSTRHYSQDTSHSHSYSYGEQTRLSSSQHQGLSPLETTSSSHARLSALRTALENSAHNLLSNSVESGSVNQPCSLELRMEETNVNELASYFEDLLHIPRKMSTMAEMMYA